MVVYILSILMTHSLVRPGRSLFLCVGVFVSYAVKKRDKKVYVQT